MPSGKIAAKPGSMTVPLIGKGEIAAEINSQPVRLYIDLGMNGSVVLSDDAWNRVIPRDTAVTTSRFTNGESVVRTRKSATGGTIRIGGATIVGPEINSETRDPRGLDGLLGNGILSHFDVVFDVPARKFVLIPLRDPAS